MRIHVTQADIDQGVRRTLTLCPVALAIKRKLGANSVTVDVSDIIPDWNKIVVDGKSLTTPLKVAGFVRRYDAGKPVSPFSFNLGV